jgi:transcriptional regulator with XRE-family HTH domain
MDINDRLRFERERLGYSQEVLGAFGGVKKLAQHLYEMGSRKPDSNYLSAIAATGIDVLFVLTGERSKSLAPSELLPADERALLNSYQNCSPQAKQHLIQTAALLAAGMGASSSAAPGTQLKNVQLKNTAPGSVQAGVVGGSIHIKRSKH